MSRRPNHVGSLSERKDGRWQGAVQVNGHRVTVYGRTKAEAKAKLDAVKRQALVNGGLPESGHTVGTLLESWLAVGDWKPRTVADYRRIAGVVRQGLRDCALPKLTPTRLQAFYATMRATPRKALYCHQVLHAACKLAVQWGWLPVNPCERVARPGYHKGEKQLWTDSQCRTFLGATRDNPWWPLWTLAITTGCRYGEIIGLRWVDIDAERQTVHVARSLQKIRREWVETTPKTQSGRRTIHLGGLAIQALQRQKVLQAEWRLAAGTGWQDTGRIFTSRLGGPLDLSSPYHNLVDTCIAMGLPRISLHTFRHLNASLALHEGVPLTLVSRSLGHSSTAITASIYSHAMAEGHAVAEGINRALAR